MAGNVAFDHERHEREPGRQGRHQDRRQALLRAAHHELRPEHLALVGLEVLEMVDHQDAVPSRDPEHRVEPDERAERQDAAADPCGECSSDQCNRQRDEGQRRETKAPERRLEQEKDRDRGTDSVDEQPILGLLSLGVLTEELCVVAKRKAGRLQSLLDLAGNGAQIASVHACKHVDAS